MKTLPSFLASRPTPGRALLIALPLAVLAAPSGAEVLDRVAAVVNTDIVTLTEVEQRAAPVLDQVMREPPGQRRDSDHREALRHALDDLIGEKLMDAELKGLNVDVSDQEVDLAIEDVKKQNNIADPLAFEQALTGQGFTMTTYREFMKKQLAKVKLLNIKVKSKIKVSDDDVKAEYARMAKIESQDTEIHARHILIQVAANATPAEVEAAHQRALAVVKEAREGADFADLARRESQGPSAKDGGDLGWFRRGTMVAEFENAAFGLKKGEVSEPVRTKFGWHVIKVEDTRQAPPKPFDEVKDQLRDRLYRDQVEHQTEAYVAELRRNASVEVKIPELQHDEPKAEPKPLAPALTAPTAPGSTP